ncbi:hypothetical protein [Propioniciclava flava]
MPRIIHTGQALVYATAMVPALPDQGQNVMAQGLVAAGRGSREHPGRRRAVGGGMRPRWGLSAPDPTAT